MRNNRLWVLVIPGLLACSSAQPPAARTVLDVTLPDSPLSRMQNVSLLHGGDGFTLAGYENGLVRWARLSQSGAMGEETGFALDPPVLGPYFAITQKAAPADQVVAIVLYPNATVPGEYGLWAIAQDLGAATPKTPVLLDSVIMDSDLPTAQIAASSATAGNLGLVAWGTPGNPIKYQLLGADAAPAFSTPKTIFEESQQPAWDCLGPTTGSTGMGFGFIMANPEYPEYSDWNTFDVDATGAAGMATYGFPTQVTNCSIAGSPNSSGGYDMAFRTVSGIGIAFYYAPPPDANIGHVMAYPLAVPAANYGSPAKVPRPAWVAGAGNDITIGLANSSGVQVVRFTYQAVPHGSALALRSASGAIGPASAWVNQDKAYVTYADLGAGQGGTSGIARYFTVVEAPAQLP